MATTAKASEHIKPCNISQSERHNRRDADYIASLNPAMLYIRKDLAHLNEVYVAPDMEGVSLQQHYDYIRIMVKQKTGRAMQEKDVKFTDKKGKQRVRQGCSPIREGVVNIKPDTTMEDLLRYAERVHERWGIRALQIHIHKDEGHYEDTNDPASWEPNYHAHIIWDWMDHDTGKSFKLNAEDMSAIQDLVAETLDMQRGQKKSETGIDHLERNDFIILKQENKKKQLQEEAKKAIAEKEEANAEVEAAKTEVADLWKEHDYLTSANRTKVERSNRLDLDIRGSTLTSEPRRTAPNLLIVLLKQKNRRWVNCQQKPTRSCGTSTPSRSVATGKTRCSLPCLHISTALTRACSFALKPSKTLPIQASAVEAASMVTSSGTTNHTPSSTT